MTAVQWIGVALVAVCVIGLAIIGPWYGRGDGDR